jgi:hypothetical protein
MEITLNVEPTTPDDLAAFAAEYEEWNKAVEAGFPMPEPEPGEEKPNVDAGDLGVDAWGLPRRPTDDCTRENWNPSSAEITQYWNNFWNGLTARMHDDH